MRYLRIPPPQIKYLIINIISITLMTQLTIVKSTLLNHKGFTFNGETPQMALIKENTLVANALASLMYLPLPHITLMKF